MYTITVLLCITLFSVGHGLTQEEKQAIHADCLSQTGVNEEIAANVINGEFVDDQKLKLFLLCFAKKAGLMNDSGDIQQGVLRATLSSMISDDGKVGEMMTKCAVQRSTAEETVFELSKCMHGKS